ncbi:hypothetical protein IX91_10920 [Vibrio tubiashii ATCC 19109]|uniref:Uncharacterized protein n=1 Tax=Vibrio tubiashii ATCC 19109 TaxID=1051646 RepID=A0A0A0SI87_9VIBR|nr:hypothetical protein IX91_10920 [Vibrio tubiashii ATCC 19109]
MSQPKRRTVLAGRVESRQRGAKFRKKLNRKVELFSFSTATCLFQANVSELAARVESRQHNTKFRKSRVVRRSFFVSIAPGLCQTMLQTWPPALNKLNTRKHPKQIKPEHMFGLYLFAENYFPV